MKPEFKHLVYLAPIAIVFVLFFQTGSITIRFDLYDKAINAVLIIGLFWLGRLSK